jgi:tryptophan-rich sensory protein
MSLFAPKRWDAVIVAALSAVVVAAIGGTLTVLGPWYYGLKKPDWTPPDAAFGIVWTVIFALAALSAVIAWRRDPSPGRRQWLIALFAVNGLLNILWSLIFFKLQRPDLAIVEVAALWLSILALIVFLWGSSRLASLLLVPYLVWVGAAAWLNYDVVRLNGPFS